MDVLDLVRLPALMELTSGRAEIVIGLIDGPVVLDHPDLASARVRTISHSVGGACQDAASLACRHGTFIAGMLSAQRSSPAPALCPGCTLLIRPLFSETAVGNGLLPGATPLELAQAIIECMQAGAHVLNLSVALVQPSSAGLAELHAALNEAARRGVLIVAAAGNQGTLTSSLITRHPWVIAVVACDRMGNPLTSSNLGHALGRRGVSAPGQDIVGLGSHLQPVRLGGTSVAAPFVTGTIALLWSLLSDATSTEIHAALTHAPGRRRRGVVPPLLDAWAAYQMMLISRGRR